MTITSKQELNAATIDDLLGPASTRFFGSGYRRIHQSMRGLAPVAQDWSHLAGVANICYPDDWSRKSTEVVRPHLSSLDALALAVRLAETSLVRRHRLTAAQQRRLSLDRVNLRAGTTPCEDLTAVPVTAVRNVIGCDDWHTTYDTRLGTMKGRVRIAHPRLSEPEPGGRPDPGIRRRDDQEAPVVSRLSRFSADYQGRTHDIEQVRINPSLGTCSARVLVRGAGVTNDGKAMVTPPTVVDAVIVIAQLAQALMYTMDDLDRSTSDTLWMRYVTVRAQRTKPSLHETVHAITRLGRANLVQLREQRWRVTTMTGALAGFDLDYSLAHQLPPRRITEPVHCNRNGTPSCASPSPAPTRQGKPLPQSPWPI